MTRHALPKIHRPWTKSPRNAAAVRWRICALALAALFREPAFGARLGDAGAEPGAFADPSSRNPLAPKLPHFTARAKSVIFLFMDGGPSQVDTFDPKPRLDREHGQPIKVKTHPTQFNNVGNVLRCPWRFRHYGDEWHPGKRPVSARGSVRGRSGDHPVDGLELFRAH